MKSIVLKASILILLVSSSCLKESNNSLFAKIEGDWKLEKYTFVFDGVVNTIDNPENEITFINCNKENNGSTITNCNAFETNEGKDYDIIYLITISNKLNIIVDFGRYPIEKLPLSFLGLENVYDLVEFTKTELVLRTPIVRDYANSRNVEDVTFYYRKQ